MPTDQLHTLIHSLSGPEKAYFRKYTALAKPGRKSYTALYEAILSQPSYDEAAIRRQLYADKPAGQLAVAKHDLFQLLLRMLRAYQLKSHNRLALRARLDHAQLLMERQLPRPALKTARSAKAKAAAADEFFLLGELLQLETRIVKAIGDKDQNVQLKKLREEERKNLEYIRIQTELQHLHDKIFSVLAAGTHVRSPEEQATVDAILRHGLVATTQPPEFLTGQLIFHSIHATHARLVGDLHGLQARYAQMLTAWERRPKRIAPEARRYFIALTSYMDICLHNYDFPRFEARLRDLSSPALVNRIDPALYFQITLQLELRYALNKPALELAGDLSARVRDGEARYGEQLPENIRLALRYNALLLTFRAGQFEASLFWARQITQLPATPLRRDIRYAARVFYILINFELDDFESLEYDLARSARFFRRKGNWYAFEKTVIKSLRAVLAADLASAKAAWQRFDEALRDVAFDGLLGHQEVVDWVSGKQ